MFPSATPQLCYPPAVFTAVLTTAVPSFAADNSSSASSTNVITEEEAMVLEHMPTSLDVDREALAAFCHKHGMRRLVLFGSASRGEEKPDSDIASST